jgi:superkiller protein 3
LLLGEAFHHAGRGEEAVDAYQRALTLRPQDFGGYVKLGRYQTELGRLDDASATFERLQQLDPQSNIASNGLGTVAMLAGRAAEARRYFSKSLELYPGDIAARQSLALLEESLGDDPAAALQHCEEIRRLAPATPGNDDCISRNRSKVREHVSGGH